MFKVGQKVVCVQEFCGKDKNGNIPYSVRIGAVKFPIKNEIYTIEESGEFLILEELVSFNIYGERHRFSSKKFRALDETFATEVLEQIKEQIEQEELVLI